MSPVKDAKPKKAKPKSAAISIWATPKDRELYKRVSKRSGESLSKLVRVLLKNYERTGVADGLPTLAAKKTKPA
jgi:hypothetical protein